VVEQRTHKPLVVGSNPSAATNVGILPEDLSLREVLGLLLGDEGKRRLRLRHLTNSQLFEAYDAQLLSKHPSAKGLYEDRRLLKHVRDFLGEFPPTPEIGKQYLAQFSNRKSATLARYSATLKLFFDWYGEPLGMKVKVPRKLPNYVEEDDIDRLIEAIKAKETHKKSVNRDVLLVEVAIGTGLRRCELAGLKVSDIDTARQLLIVRDEAKGGKHRAVPLTINLARRLEGYTQGMSKEDKLFGLARSTISSKIGFFSKKAGVKLHPHSFRDHFGTKLLERGATIREVQELLGHASLANTERYTLLTSRHLRRAVDLLAEDKKRPKPGEFTITASAADEY